MDLLGMDKLELDDNVGSSENHLHPKDNQHSPSGSGSGSASPIWNKKGSSSSQSSLEFGKGERRDEQRSPSPNRHEMLKHATTAPSSVGQVKQVKSQNNLDVPTNNGTASTSGSQTTTVTIERKGSAVSATGSDSAGSTSTIKLPQRFVVKYLGFRETSNLWGIKYTRRPVDEMVNQAKTVLATNPEKALALLKMEVSEEGIIVAPMPQNTNPNILNGKFSIESISYGVQDLVYTRVFAMIVVKGDGQSAVKLSQLVNQSANGGGGGGSLPFRCHAFVCDSRHTARRLTYSLASAFEIFSKKVTSGKIIAHKPKKFAIDLRPAEEIEKELAVEDSEA